MFNRRKKTTIQAAGILDVYEKIKNLTGNGDEKSKLIELYDFVVYHTTDSLEAELNMILSLSVVAIFIAFIPIQSIGRDEVQIASDEDGQIIEVYDRAVGICMYLSVVLGATASSLSLIIYIAWRSHRPHPENKQFPMLFYEEFKHMITAVYVLLCLMMIFLSVSTYYLFAIKTSTYGMQTAEGAIGACWWLTLCIIGFIVKKKYNHWTKQCDIFRELALASGEKDVSIPS
jgi:hypothetical protein